MNKDLLTAWLTATIKMLAALVAVIFNAMPTTVQTLVICMTIDIGTGLAVALKYRLLRGHLPTPTPPDTSPREREFGLHRLTSGLLVKVSTLVLIGLAWMLERRMGVPGLTAGVSGWFVARELLSILRNMKEIGVPVPRGLLRVVEMMREGAVRRMNGGENQ